MSLTAALSDESKRNKVVDECVDLVDDEVKKKGGLGGMVIKAGYKAVKGIKPGFIRSTVNALLDSWATELDPIWAEGGDNPRKHLEGQKSRVADALLKVTDDRAKSTSHKIVRSSYEKLRPTAKKHVEEAVPGLAGLLERNL